MNNHPIAEQVTEGKKFFIFHNGVYREIMIGADVDVTRMYIKFSDEAEILRLELGDLYLAVPASWMGEIKYLKKENGQS